MKSIKKIIFAAAFFAVLVFQTDSLAIPMGLGSGLQVTEPTTASVDEVLTTEREKIQQLTIDTEKIKAAATIAINDAQNKLAKDEISQLQAAKIIGEQNYKIEQAEKQLAEVVKQSVEDVQEAEQQEQSYMSRFITGVKDIGTRVLEKVGYSKTEQQKGIAQSIITELEKQLEEIREEYEEKIQEATSAQEKDQLNFEYNKIKQEFKDEIYQQKLITGDESKTNKKLWIAAVGAAGVVIGAAVAKQYLGTNLASVEKEIAKERMQKVAREKEFEEMETKYKFPELGFGLTPKERHGLEKAGKALIEAPQYRDREEDPFGGVEIYGATEPGESYYEQLKKWSDESQPSEAALERKKQATNVIERQTTAQEAQRQELKSKRRTEEEVKQLTSEIGEDILKRVQPFAEATEAAGRRALGVSQFSDEEPIALTPEEMKIREEQEQQLRETGQRGQEAQKRAPAVAEFAEKVANKQLEERDIETYEGTETPGESYAEQMSEAMKSGAKKTWKAGPKLRPVIRKRFVEAERYPTPADEIFDSVGDMYGEEPESLTRFKEVVNPYIEPVKETVKSYGQSLSEAAREAATSPKHTNPEEGGI